MNVKKGILSVILGMSAVGLFTKILTTFFDIWQLFVDEKRNSEQWVPYLAGLFLVIVFAANVTYVVLLFVLKKGREKLYLIFNISLFAFFLVSIIIFRISIIDVNNTSYAKATHTAYLYSSLEFVIYTVLISFSVYCLECLRDGKKPFKRNKANIENKEVAEIKEEDVKVEEKTAEATEEEQNL